MKTSAIKIFKSWFNSLTVNNFKKQLNQKTIVLGTIVLFTLIIIIYFTRPFIFNYDLEREFIEKEINRVFKLQAKIKGNISYNFLPSPRLVVEKIDLGFNNSDKNKINVVKSKILLSPLKLMNIKNLRLEKFLISDEKIQVYPDEFKNYLKYFSLQKDNNLFLKNSELFFINRQKDEVLFNNFYFKQKTKNKTNKITLNTFFSNNKVKIKFLDELDKKKYFKASIPTLDVFLDIVFDSGSDLENFSGQLKLDLLQSILLINFKAKEYFVISESFFRNKFINSKLEGKILLKDNFVFDLNLSVNKINLRKLLFYYFSPRGNSSASISGISKKINGEISIKNKSANSFLGKINNTQATLIFENGDVKIKNGFANFLHDTKVNFDALYTLDRGIPKIDFSINLHSDTPKGFFRKFDLYGFQEKKISIFSKGSLNLQRREIKFKDIVINGNERLGKGDILVVEKKFNKNVIGSSVLDIFDFFKLKKFAKEVFYSEG